MAERQYFERPGELHRNFAELKGRHLPSNVQKGVSREIGRGIGFSRDDQAHSNEIEACHCSISRQ